MSSSAPTPTPNYIYKILPSSPPPPSPLPVALPVSALDASDNFIHLSTSLQILATLGRFFADVPHVYILRVPYDRIEKWIRWEDGQNRAGEGEWTIEERKDLFPHVHGNGMKLGREEIDEVKIWKRGGEGWKSDGWPFGHVDRPVE